MKTSKIRSTVRTLIVFVSCLFVMGPGLSSAGVARAGQGSEPQLLTCPGTPEQCFADVPPDNGFFENANRIYQQGIVSGYPCGGAIEPCDSDNRPYYRPGNTVTRQQMSKFVDLARRLAYIEIAVQDGNPPIQVSNVAGDALLASSVNSIGVRGISSSSYGVVGQSTTGIGLQGSSTTDFGIRGISAGPAAINGWNTGTGYGVEGRSDDASGIALYGYSDNGRGALGSSSNNIGVEGRSNVSNGVYGRSVGGYGVIGETTGDNTVAGVGGSSTEGKGVVGSSTNSYGVSAESLTNIGLYARTNNNQSYAGWFQGGIYVIGPCTGCFGPTKVDHPLDPENRYLYQSTVQSDDMMNIYNGNAVTGADGLATVQLPEYFEALNHDFRYQLTPIGQFTDAIVWQEIVNNSFVIKTDKPNVKVSWMVTGTRHDLYADANRVAAEQDKPADEKGTYLYPELYGQPESRGVDHREK